MSGKHCKLYDEVLVRNIMVSTTQYVLDYGKDHQDATEDEVCGFIEANADGIIQYTIDEMNDCPDPSSNEEKDSSPDLL